MARVSTDWRTFNESDWLYEESETDDEIPNSSDVDSESESSEESGSRKWIPKIVDQEVAIFFFYESVLNNLMREHTISEVELSCSMRKITNSYRRVSNGQLPDDVDYTQLENCLGYLHRYAACHSFLVRTVLVKLMYTLPQSDLFLKLFQSTLNVVFLGGGPGNDAVGFMSALYGLHHELFELNVTIIDKMPGWKLVLDESFDKLRRGDEFVEASRLCDDVNVIATFKECDVGSSIEDGEEDLENAELVFMVKFLSHVPDEEKENILENVVERMSLGSLLLYVDHPFPYAAFSSLNNRLELIDFSPSRQFTFNVKKSRFGFKNITKTTAELRLYKVIM